MSNRLLPAFDHEPSTLDAIQAQFAMIAVREEQDRELKLRRKDLVDRITSKRPRRPREAIASLPTSSCSQRLLRDDPMLPPRVPRYEAYYPAAHNRRSNDTLIMSLPYHGGLGSPDPFAYEAQRLTDFCKGTAPKGNGVQLDRADFALPDVYEDAGPRRQLVPAQIEFRYSVFKRVMRECVGIEGDVIDEHYSRRLDDEYDEEAIERLAKRTGRSKAAIGSAFAAIRQELGATPAWITHDALTVRSPYLVTPSPSRPEDADGLCTEFCGAFQVDEIKLTLSVLPQVQLLGALAHQFLRKARRLAATGRGVQTESEPRAVR